MKLVSKKLGAIATIAALLLAACGGDDDTATTAASGATEGSIATGAATGEPIIIGAAVDLAGNMAPFDAPALTAAQITIDKINAAGGVRGRPLKMEVIDTKLDPAQTKTAAVDLLTKSKADILWVTCDVDFATPAIQAGLDAKKLTVSPCIGTDQMGPKRFGEPGKLAFSFGNVAQDEGAAMAEWAVKAGYKSAIVVPDNLLAYFQNVCDSFTQRFEEKGGKIVAETAFQTGDDSVNSLASNVAKNSADMIALCTFPPSITPAVQGMRDAGITSPMVSPWSGDGTFWIPKDLSDFHVTTFASVFGDDPNPDVAELVKAMEAKGNAPGTGGFLTGAGAIEGIVAAIEATDGDLDGTKLAAAMEAFDGVDTISGKITFTKDFHTVSGREYRVITFTKGTPKFVELFAASSPAAI